MTILLAGLLALGDAAQAGAAYREGLEEIRKSRFDAAVAKFREAVQHEAAETDKLQYRDNQGRQSHEYYPQYEWARARILQAEGEAPPERKREFLQEAILHLGLTKHPQAAARLGEAKARLAEAEKLLSTSAPDPFAAPFAALRRKVEELCARKEFEAAFRAVEAEGKLFEARPRDREDLLNVVRNGQKVVLDGHAGILALSLRNLSSTDPTGRPEAVLPLLTPARVPPAVQRAPGEPFRWLEQFVSLYEREKEGVGKAASLGTTEAVRIAEAFEGSAELALLAGSIPGFRAARWVARSVRLARPGREDGAAVLDSWERAAARWGADLRKRLDDPSSAIPKEEIRAYLAEDLAADLRRIQEIRGEIDRRAKARALALEAADRAERSLSEADAAALAKAAGELAAVESGPSFVDLPADLRARALYARALVELVSGFLDARPAEKVQDLVLRARAADPKVDAAWRGRLSPRLQAALDRIGPR